MSGVLIDSDVLIEVLRGRDSELLRRWADLAVSQRVAVISPVNIAEIGSGARTQETSMIEALFRALPCLPIDVEIGKLAGEFLRRYRKSHSVELGDALLAASATVHGLALWTRNRKHYPMKEIAFY